MSGWDGYFDQFVANLPAKKHAATMRRLEAEIARHDRDARDAFRFQRAFSALLKGEHKRDG